MRGAASRVMVALSGGVDSAVAALCLLRQGHAVEALHMSNWDEADEYCTAGSDLADARKICDDLEIPFHHVNFAREYRDEVFAGFLEDLRDGRTPNPDVGCNRHIKFGAFLRHARRLGAECIATGHYARVVHAPRLKLLRAADADKDQTYFLHAVEPAALRQTLFPLGDLRKDEVRALARDYGLAVHAKADSTGICFVGERPFRDFLKQYLPVAPGPIRTADGQCVGEHSGLSFYTLGQRQGLGIGGQCAAEQAPWFVAAKDPVRNALIVVQGQDHPALFRRELMVGKLRWLHGEPEGIGEGVGLSARIRHRQPPAPCELRRADTDTLSVRFADPQRSPAPGQFAVFYRDDECLGGGVILAAHPATPSARNEAPLDLTGTGGRGA